MNRLDPISGVLLDVGWQHPQLAFDHAPARPLTVDEALRAAREQREPMPFEMPFPGAAGFAKNNGACRSHRVRVGSLQTHARRHRPCSNAVQSRPLTLNPTQSGGSQRLSKPGSGSSRGVVSAVGRPTARVGARDVIERRACR